MKKLSFHMDESSATLNTESKDRFSTTQRFVITLVAIVSAAFVLSACVAPVLAVLFFGFVALLVAIVVSGFDKREKAERRQDRKEKWVDKMCYR